jgi:adenylate cyclase
MFERLAGPRTSRAARRPVTAGVLTLGLCLMIAGLMPPEWRETLREDALDFVLAVDHRVRRPPQNLPDVIIIDIDRRSIEALGPWPWPRETMARLMQAIAAARPAATAIDILFAEADERSPAALARKLGALVDRADLATLAESLPDGDKLLAEALRQVPTALGFVLDPDRTEAVAAAPVVTRGALHSEQIWSAAGAVGPVPGLAAAAAGLGVLSLPGDADGVVRRVPLLVAAAERLYPGLALEAVRLRQGASTYLVDAETPSLRVGAVVLPLPRDAMLRLVPLAPYHRIERTMSAADLIEGRADSARIAGAIALVGGSAPELGGLRQTSFDPLTPSVQIHADAIAQIAAGRIPRPFDAAQLIEMLSWLGLGLLAIAVGVALPPLAGAAVVLGAILLACVAAVGGSLRAERLVDPLAPSAVAALVFVATSVTAFAGARRRAALVRFRFEQHLAPAVVRRIVEQPGLMKLSGERREVTALFTDIESFTAMTHRVEPENLVALLDEYFEGAAAIIIDHGGMIDKLIGDAVHALFNAPIDLSDHPRRAVDCAIALHDWSENYRRQAAPAAAGFGRTRVGIETGMAVVGDVGIRAKLDYTAHGDAINAAARFESANKDLGSAICVGPEAASRCDPAMFRPLGSITVRGRDDPLTVYEPWPPDVPAEWRERYRAAFRLSETDRAKAADLFAELAAERRGDAVPRLMSERLRASLG